MENKRENEEEKYLKDEVKEFIKKNGEFTINIALIDNKKPVLGVVEAPVLKTVYAGIVGQDAWKKIKQKKTVLENSKPVNLSHSGLRIVASRSHLNKDTQEFLDNLNNPKIVSMGSSLKFMMVADGKADVYPRFAPTMEWDTAAAHAIINSIGANVVDQENNDLLYNKENLLNPFFKVY